MDTPNDFKTALLIEVTGIQDYVFGSNRLMDNIGASYIIEHLLLNPYDEQNGIIRNLGNSPEFREKIDFKYIGGGNAFLMTDIPETARAFCTALSAQVIEQFPGLRLAFGIKDNFRIGEGFKEDRKALAADINRMKSGLYGGLLPFKPGFAESCAAGGMAAEVAYESNNESKPEFLASSIYAKRTLIDLANDWLFERYEQALGEKFEFPKSFDQFGQEESGYIAVVHIDGNGLGKRFMGSRSLAEVIEQSKGVADALEQTGQDFMHYICGTLMKMYKLKEQFNFVSHEKHKERTYLPIRPLIMAGDDITFVCEGRLGLHLAGKYIEFFEKNGIKACAGVAIAHTHYPFSSAYHASEQLIGRAKNRARSSVPEGDNNAVAPSCLEYGFITDSGVEGLPVTDYHGGPYHLNGVENPWQAVKEKVLELRKLPAVKVHAIREAIKGDAADRKYLREVLRRNGLHGCLPIQDTDNHDWKILNDAIEIMDFYPECLLKEPMNQETEHATSTQTLNSAS
jgi:hypothetical protein